MDEQLENLALWIQQIETKVQTINERTKNHTIDIKKLEKWVKEKKGEKQK